MAEEAQWVRVGACREFLLQSHGFQQGRDVLAIRRCVGPTVGPTVGGGGYSAWVNVCVNRGSGPRLA
jgi:hypothetical protein